jgi:TDG/mug DNA glycosylase family protein
MVLPDVLRPGLRAVFCGTAAGAASGRRGAYYAGPGNKFWRTLHEVGLTPRELRPEEFWSVLDYGLGLTDLSKRRSGSDLAVGVDDFDVPRLAQLVRDNAPVVIAFNGKNAGRGAFGHSVDYGRQDEDFAGAEAWVLPSTSGAASGAWDRAAWRDLAERLR